jgi:hypothetical protein
MAQLITPEGEEKIVRPADKATGFTLDEVHRLIGCDCIDVILLADGRRMVIEDDFSRQAINEKATALYQEGRRSAWAMRGNVVVGTRKEIR